MSLRRFVLALARLLPLLGCAVAGAYPGADAGPKPWQPPRGRPAPTAALQLVPPTALLQPLVEAGIPTSGLGLYVRRVDARKPFAALNEDQPLALASTAKIVTALAALDLLGADYRWTTQAQLRGEIVDGRLAGDLVIVGGGDATLRSDALRRWFVQLREQGLREIGGDIVLDRLAFDLSPEDFARTPLPDPERPHHAWPDAFVIDEGALGVQRIGFAPPSPAEATARAVTAAWAEAGGALKGRVVARTAPPAPLPDAAGEPGPPFAVLASAALPQLVREMNKASNNMLARHLLLSLAPGFPQRPARLASARERVQDWLRAQGLRDEDIELDSGAGLSRLDRGKARALVQLLAQAWRGPAAQAFVESLPIAGVDGTLANRLQGGPAEGRAWLKTGTLLDARALAGYVKGRSGKVYAVAVILNHPEAARAVPALDALIEWIAREG